MISMVLYCILHTLILSQRDSFYMLKEIQVGLGLVLYHLISNLVKVLARVRESSRFRTSSASSHSIPNIWC